MATHPQPDIRSLRVFGGIWALFFTVIALWPMLDGGQTRLWALALAGAFLLVAAVLPTLFARSGMYRGWVKFGEVVGLINSRIIMFVMFVTIFAPVGLAFRLMRRDVLHKRFDPEAKTYFVNRDTQPGPMRNQF